MTAPTTAPALTEAETRSDRVRRWLLAGATAAAPFVLLATIPFETDTGDADSGVESLNIIAEDRGQFWATGFALAVGLVMLAVAGLAVMALVRRRGAVLATIGGSLLFVAGISAAAAIYMYTTVNHAMTDPAMDREAMGLLDQTASESAQAGIPFIIGFPGMALALLLCGIALFRSGTVPLFVSVPIALAGPAMMAGGSGAAFALTISPLLALTGVAVELVRRRTRAVEPADVPLPAGALR